MAEYLASIFGTEKDKVNCSFYFKIGACRHGDRCSRFHTKPLFSQTILIQNLYQNPRLNSHVCGEIDENSVINGEVDRHFDEFFEEVYVELYNKYGEIEEMNVCDNLGDHLLGNVYVKFRNEAVAEKAVNDLNNRWFGGRPIVAELSPVTDFDDACCRQYEEGKCMRRGVCNFLHLKKISDDLFFKLYGRWPRKRFRNVFTIQETNVDFRLKGDSKRRSRSRRPDKSRENRRRRNRSRCRQRSISNGRHWQRGLKRRSESSGSRCSNSEKNMDSRDKRRHIDSFESMKSDYFGESQQFK